MVRAALLPRPTSQQTQLLSCCLQELVFPVLAFLVLVFLVLALEVFLVCLVCLVFLV